MKTYRGKNSFLKTPLGPFAETYEATYAQTYPETFANNLDDAKLKFIPPDIFDPINLDKTIWHIHLQSSASFYGLSEDDLEVVDQLLDEIKVLVELSPGQNEYTASQDNNVVTITKAADDQSTDHHLSYNKATLRVNNVTVEWYFTLTVDGAEVEEDFVKNNQADAGKPEVLYEKSEANKVDGFNRNNTGYKFWWSDGRVMDHGDVENFINRKRAAGDKRFLADFPVVKEGELAPSYTIVGRKQPYYAYDKRLKDPYEDGDNLKSTLLSGDYNLEQAYDGHIIIGSASKGETVNGIKRALNKIYEADKTFVRLVENGNYDINTVTAVKRFQTDNKLGHNGNVGKETLRVLDSKINSIEIAVAEAEKLKQEEEKKKQDEYAIDHLEKTSSDYHKDVEDRMRNPKIMAMVTALSTVGNDLYGERFRPMEVLELTEAQKQKIFQESADKTLAILMSEFVEGHGREIREFGPETPISEEIKYSYTTSLFLQYFVGAYDQGLFEEGVMNGPLTIFTSPDNSSQNPPGLPGAKEIALKAFGQILWNDTAFYTGSLDYFFTVKGNTLEIMVHNEYSIASGVTRNDDDNLMREEGKLSPLGNTKQLFYFSFDISKLKK